MKNTILKILYLIVAIISFATLVYIALLGYEFSFTGFNQYELKDGQIVPGKTLWDWLELLVIPFVLAVAAYFLNKSERRNEIELQRRNTEAERTIALERTHEAALQNYFDSMSQLMLSGDLLKPNPESPTRIVARARTLSVLRVIDPVRKAQVLSFLMESRLLEAGKMVVDIKGADFSNIDMVDANLSKADFSQTNFSNANLSKANLSGSILDDANFGSVNLDFANISDCSYNNGTILDSKWGKVLELYDASERDDYTGEDFSRVNFSDVKCKFLDFSSANFQDAILSEGSFTHCEFANANFSGTQFQRGDFTSASFVENKYGKKSLLQRVKQFVLAIFRDEQTTFLKGADLSNVHLNKADLSNLDLSRTNFSYSYLKGANFSNTILNETDFTEVNGDEANFRSAQIENAKSLGSSFQGADFSLAKITGLFLFKTAIEGANFSGTNLSDYEFLSFGNSVSDVILPSGKKAEEKDLGIVRRARLSIDGQIEGMYPGYVNSAIEYWIPQNLYPDKSFEDSIPLPPSITYPENMLKRAVRFSNNYIVVYDRYIIGSQKDVNTYYSDLETYTLPKLSELTKSGNLKIDEFISFAVFGGEFPPSEEEYSIFKSLDEYGSMNYSVIIAHFDPRERFQVLDRIDFV